MRCVLPPITAALWEPSEEGMGAHRAVTPNPVRSHSAVPLREHRALPGEPWAAAAGQRPHFSVRQEGPPHLQRCRPRGRRPPGPGPPEGEARARPALRHRAHRPLQRRERAAPPAGRAAARGEARRDGRGERPVRGEFGAERPMRAAGRGGAKRRGLEGSVRRLLWPWPRSGRMAGQWASERRRTDTRGNQWARGVQPRRGRGSRRRREGGGGLGVALKARGGRGAERRGAESRRAARAAGRGGERRCTGGAEGPAGASPDPGGRPREGGPAAGFGAAGAAPRRGSGTQRPLVPRGPPAPRRGEVAIFCRSAAARGRAGQRRPLCCGGVLERPGPGPFCSRPERFSRFLRVFWFYFIFFSLLPSAAPDPCVGTALIWVFHVNAVVRGAGRSGAAFVVRRGDGSGAAGRWALRRASFGPARPRGPALRLPSAPVLLWLIAAFSWLKAAVIPHRVLSAFSLLFSGML